MTKKLSQARLNFERLNWTLTISLKLSKQLDDKQILIITLTSRSYNKSSTFIYKKRVCDTNVKNESR